MNPSLSHMSIYVQSGHIIIGAGGGRINSPDSVFLSRSNFTGLGEMFLPPDLSSPTANAIRTIEGRSCL